ncbi:DUF6875 domain-containing protein [Streptomyces sp. NPDC087212]|uniref:DUF6875 domain-containing protein n=1 Tax=Streptomyces sp. NPDC087212 TaxID=3365766 RepID=UPI003822AFF2
MTTRTAPAAPPASSGFRGDIAVSPAQGHEGRLREDLATFTDWLRDYVSRPHRELRRRGAVCPFVPAALNARTLNVRCHYGVSGTDPDALRHLLADELTRFTRRRPQLALDGLAVLLPDLTGDGIAALDDAHARLKDVAVTGGAMIGQFHPACDETSVRNDGFRVSRSPLPLLAVRHMAVHDILFLHERPDWFAAYRERFGGQFTEGRVREPLMLGLFALAERRHLPRTEA